MVPLKFTILAALLVHGSNAWFWPRGGEERNPVNFDLDVDDQDSFSASSGNNGDEDGPILEEEDAEHEQNLRCAASLNRNLQRVLKSIMPHNYTHTLERLSRQDDPDTESELFQSMLDLELSQLLVPVLKILVSAAAANATAIDENYNSLPFAARYQVTDLIKFTVDLLQTT